MSPQWSAFTCFENTLGLTQVTVQFFCFSFIVLFFYKYYPTNLKETPLHERDIRVSYVFVATKAVAGVFGAVAMTAAICQFFPQIVHTWRAKKVGALSIPMMMMQVPGAFIFVYSLASQPVLCLYYSRKEKREGDEDETDPLITEGGRRDGSEVERGYGTAEGRE
ncbi:hypothetical protein HK097_002847 [Rhizophlyctis rosea]|uniref:Uncharacterized protein n=1 Tax=Rhizophlyctis rosea TaxID=64517 RepID=A0AAD5X7R7_9FUNG|nr:hypothetical protein HK097_002847 [Rhizophlyctis rosea]